MGFQNAYSAYQNTAVKTASQGKLVVMLYEGAVRQLAAAEKCFDPAGKVPAHEIETFGNHIMKAQEIIGELQTSLDMDKGGQIAQNLMSLYVYFNHELMEANISKDRQRLGSVHTMLSQLAEAWETAASNAANASAAAARPALNITG